MSEGRKRGPKRKDGAQLEPLTIRMDAKLKFGLELLARHQGRSLSQATEWALQHALTTVRVGANKVILWHVLSVAWDREGWRRWHALYDFDPTLVPFEERHACMLVENSPEMEFLRVRLENLADSKEWLDRFQKWETIIDAYWPILLEDASSRLFETDGHQPLLVEIGVAEEDDSKAGIPALIDEVYSNLSRTR